MNLIFQIKLKITRIDEKQDADMFCLKEIVI